MQPFEAPALELRYAAECISSMQVAASVDDYERLWKDLLSRLERCHNKIEALYKGEPSWHSWSGSFTSLRKSDPLLKYLRHARNVEEHTVTPIVVRTTPMISIKTTISIGDYYSGEVVGASKVDPDAAVIRSVPDEYSFVPSRMMLVEVVDRGVTYPVPRIHLGSPVDPTDVASIAQLGLQFYENMLEQAHRRFSS